VAYQTLKHRWLHRACIPTLAAKPPSRPGWVHEIKDDGYRLTVRRDDRAVRLFTRRGHDWTDRYPAIAAAAAKLRVRYSPSMARRRSPAPMASERHLVALPMPPPEPTISSVELCGC
jgi:hypothetical protein